MSIKQGDILSVEITDTGMGGEGIAHHEDYTIFVPYTLQGESVRTKIVHVKSRMAFAKLLEVVKVSPARIKPVCKLFKQCGGCDFLHVQYTEELKYKRNALINTLNKLIPVTDNPDDTSRVYVNEVVPSRKPMWYRNKVQLPFGINKQKKIILGLYSEKTHNVCEMSDCFLHGYWLRPLISIVTSFANEENLTVYNGTNAKNGLLRHMVARYIDDKLCVTLVATSSNIPNIDKLKNKLQREFSDVSLFVDVNAENTNVIMGRQIKNITENKQFLNIMGINNIILNPYSFFQVNDYIREKLYNKVIEIIAPDSNTTVIDAYSGVGLMGAIMAKKGAQIINIEEVHEAIINATDLYKENRLEGYINLCGKAEKMLQSAFGLVSVNQKLTVVVDPPRKGLDTEVISTLLNLADERGYRIIYISCNPATLGRDLKALATKFNIEFIAPYDMFPRTKHVECVVLMSKVQK